MEIKQKIIYPWFFPLIRNDIAWCVPDFLHKGQDSLIFPALKIDCEIPWFSLTLANLYSAVYRKTKPIYQLKGKTFFFNEQVKSRAHPVSKSAPEWETVRHDGRTVFEKCARGNFSAPFAQWRSPNASLLECSIDTF